MIRGGNRFVKAGRFAAAIAMVCGALGAWGDSAQGVETVTVTLVGGTKITAPLLRQNDEGVVLDLGYDVLHVPAKKLLDVQKQEPKTGGKPAAGSLEVADQGLFTVGRLEAAEVPELVRRHGDSVVMIRNAAGRGSGFVISKQGQQITRNQGIYLPLRGFQPDASGAKLQ